MSQAVIIGGGIAGIGMALALRRAGIEPCVYETYPADVTETGGALITVWSNGMHALRQLGALDEVTAASLALHTVEIVGADGARLGALDVTQPYPPLPGFRHMLRGTLNLALHRVAAQAGIRIVHGRRLADVTPHGDRVAAVFDDGETVPTELLIGADGAHSTARRCVDPAAPGARYTGERVVYGTSETADDTTRLRMLLVEGATFGHAGAPGERSWWFCRVRDAEAGREALAAGPRELGTYVLDRFAGHPCPPTELVRASSTIQANNTWDLYDLPRWHDGRNIVLIGDAAHATAPSSAQGAALAVEDAVVLARALRDLPDNGTAFAAYERMRRARANRIVYGGAAQARSRPQRDRPRTGDRQEWLYDYPLDWEIPVTETLAEQVAASQQP